MRSPALAAYMLASRLADPLVPSVLRGRLRRGKEDPARLPERLGRPGVRRPKGRLVWVHGASVGEATSALPLIEALRARVDATILVTSGTVTSARRLEELLPPGAIHQFVPVDTRGPVGRFLAHWRPDLAVLIESELWPRLVLETARRDVPMALINARLSERSFRRWRRLPGMARRILGAFRLILAQDGETVERLGALGIKARYGGNLKALVRMPECDADKLATMRAALDGRAVWLAASTHAGEERPVLEAQHALRREGGPLLVLAPRHPDRGDDIHRQIARAGLAVVRRSSGGFPTAETDVWLADTLGEMGIWYRLSPVSFVGGSLVKAGGHTPFEPVQLGSVVLHGPHVFNFAPAYAALDQAGGAIPVESAPALAAAVTRLTRDPALADALRQRARAAHEALKPELGAIADGLIGLMERAG
jgi:3-deoxy-D-manno-octulosonic-acid transferase